MKHVAGQIEGFTLTELLVSLSLLALLFLLIGAALSLNLNTLSSVRDVANNTHRVDVVEDFLRVHLERARPFVDRGNQRSGQIRFEGRRDMLRFLSNLSSRWEGLPQEMELAVDRDGNLNLAICDEISERRPWCDNPVSTLLLEDVRQFQISYYDAKLASWRESWAHSIALPDLIRIHTEFETSGQREIEIVIHPRIDVDTSCHFNPATRSCWGR